MVFGKGETKSHAANRRGDIAAILDTKGHAVVEYIYDAWGNILPATDSILGNLNPLRYRGYVYDRETGFYYLQFRYYEPKPGGFCGGKGFLFR